MEKNILKPRYRAFDFWKREKTRASWKMKKYINMVSFKLIGGISFSEPHPFNHKKYYYKERKIQV